MIGREAAVRVPDPAAAVVGDRRGASVAVVEHDAVSGRVGGGDDRGRLEISALDVASELIEVDLLAQRRRLRSGVEQVCQRRPGYAEQLTEVDQGTGKLERGHERAAYGVPPQRAPAIEHR